MEARQVDAMHGWQWIVSGYGLFRKNPLLWIMLLGTYLLAALIFYIIPKVGSLLWALLAPVFTAGFMLGCKALEAGEELELAHLFAGFQKNLPQLLTIGGIYVAVSIVVFVAAVSISGGVPAEVADLAAAQTDPAVALAALQKLMSIMLLALLLMIPLLMAYWFAPALVVFADMAAIAAMKLSFVACFKNPLPFLVYGGASLLLLVLAMIPFGAGLLILVPTLIASVYTGYQDIFGKS